MVLQGARGILGASLLEGGREMPVLVLLDPALGGSATLLYRVLETALAAAGATGGVSDPPWPPAGAAELPPLVRAGPGAGSGWTRPRGW